MAEQTGVLPTPRIEGARLLIVAAPFYRSIADGLTAGARAVLGAGGAEAEVLEVPGALEIPTAIALASDAGAGAGADAGAYDGYVALGCVIRGETTHYETVCEESARGLTLLGLRGVAIGNGVLTCETLAQAEARA
ncbi:MAG: 6,7-dimethyl-8-ribityllumazine synthase, partial [Pseudomonadota bacterium]